jgi:hypothetical protein
MVRKILLAGKEADEWTALQGVLVPKSAAKHGISRFQGIEDGSGGSLRANFEMNLA